MSMLAMAAPPPLALAAAPARMLAFGDEFRFSLSRRVVGSGRLVLQLKNIGEDDHDLRIVGPGGTARAETGIVTPGGLGEIRTRLGRGRYTFFCTVADHAARGMAGSFLVTAPKRRPR